MANPPSHPAIAAHCAALVATLNDLARSAPRDEDGGLAMYVGHFNPDPTVPTAAKLAEAVAGYEERFRRPAAVVLTSHLDALDVADEEVGILVIARDYIHPGVFYVGGEEELIADAADTEMPQAVEAA